MLEKVIERHLIDAVKKKGGACLKLTGYRGIPDRMILYHGKVFFVELKQAGKELRPDQKIWQDKLRAMGFVAVKISSHAEADGFVKSFLTGV